MSEQEINEFLLKGRKASDEQRSKGNIEAADRIIQITSLIALRHNLPTRKVICPTCNKQLRTKEEITFFNAAGQCMNCEYGYMAQDFN